MLPVYIIINYKQQNFYMFKIFLTLRTSLSFVRGKVGGCRLDLKILATPPLFSSLCLTIVLARATGILSYFSSTCPIIFSE